MVIDSLMPVPFQLDNDRVGWESISGSELLLFQFGLVRLPLVGVGSALALLPDPEKPQHPGHYQFYFYPNRVISMSLQGPKTQENLKDAFAGESQTNRRYLYFAAKADVEGHNDVSTVFRSTAEGETGHAHGHLEYLEEVSDPATGLPIGGTSDNLQAIDCG